jgi:hypothetical protein
MVIMEVGIILIMPDIIITPTRGTITVLPITIIIMDGNPIHGVMLPETTAAEIVSGEKPESPTAEKAPVVLVVHHPPCPPALAITVGVPPHHPP